MKPNNSPNMVSVTLKILNITGTPFAEIKKVLANEVDDLLLEYALSNRMHLFFLESLRRYAIDTFSVEFQQLIEKYDRVNGTIVKIAETLEKNNIEYSFFKSIRPYREVTVDIDIIIFNDCQKAIRVLKDTGLRLLETGPLSTTLRDETSEINIDLYEEIGVSYIIYMDKERLFPFIVKRTIEDGHVVKSLDAIADLLAIISHSIIKEQMYVLSEYFTTIYYLHQMTSQELDKLIEMAKQWKLKEALSTHLSITSAIHMKAHGFIPKPLEKLLETVGYNDREMERVRKREYQTPYKYHPLTVVDSFAEKLFEEKARRSIAIQLLKMSNPTFAINFLKGTLKHVSRNRY